MTSVLLVTGMPGAGKSTVTRLLAQRLPRAARLDGDVVNRFVVGGRVGFGQEPLDEFLRQRDLCDRNMAVLAANFADAGFAALIDTVITTRAQWDRFTWLLAPRSARLVVLEPGIEACKYRNTIRAPEERFYFDGYEALEAQMRAELGDAGWWFDTSAIDPEETVDRILGEVFSPSA